MFQFWEPKTHVKINSTVTNSMIKNFWKIANATTKYYNYYL